jgi:hypothetical protein
MMMMRSQKGMCPTVPPPSSAGSVSPPRHRSSGGVSMPRRSPTPSPTLKTPRSSSYSRAPKVTKLYRGMTSSTTTTPIILTPIILTTIIIIIMIIMIMIIIMIIIIIMRMDCMISSSRIRTCTLCPMNS